MADLIEQLRARSARLHAPQMQPRRLGISELVSADIVSGLMKRSLDDSDELKAVKLLAQENFDASSLSSEVKDIYYESLHNPREEVEGLDLEGYLTHRHDTVILTAIEDAQACAERSVRLHQKRWLQEEWTAAKGRLLESMGHISHAWRGGESRSHPSQSLYDSTSGFSTVHPSGPPSAMPYSLMTTPSTSLGSGTSSAISLLADDESQSPLRTDDEKKRIGALNPLLQKHSQSVQSLCQATHTTNGSLALLRQSSHTLPTPHSVFIFRQLASDTASILPLASRSSSAPNGKNSTTTIGLSRADLLGYQSALELAAEMVGEPLSGSGNFSLISPGNFSPVTFDAPGVIHALSDLADNLRQSFTLGAIQYLRRQQWALLTRDIDECTGKGLLDFPVSRNTAGAAMTSTQQRLVGYVSYLFTEKAIYPGVSNPSHDIECVTFSTTSTAPSRQAPIWALLYFSLASGDIDDAMSIIELVRESSVLSVATKGTYVDLYAAVSTVLSFSREALTTSKVVDTLAMSQQLASAMNKLRSAFNELQQPSSYGLDSASDVYKKVVLNLLSLSDEEQLIDPGISGYSIHNYLWARLWFVALYRAVKKNEKSLGFASNSTSFFSSGKVYSEDGLYKDVVEFGGAHYFDPSGERPFKYATVLLCCQRFGEAASYVWNSGRSIPAVHLIIGLLHYGLLLPHVSLSASSTEVQNVDLSPASMLTIFLSPAVQQSFPSLCVDYFMTLNTNWRTHMTSVSAEMNDVLDIHTIRSRQTLSKIFEDFICVLGEAELKSAISKLEQYVNKSQTSDLLYRSAKVLLVDRREPASAVRLFFLAGKYTEVVDELCNQLSAVVASAVTSMSRVSNGSSSGGSVEAGQYNAVRTYWMSTAADFFTTHLSSTAKSDVLNCLIRDGKEGLASTLQHLLNLGQFFDLVGDKKYRDALRLLQSVDIIPATPGPAVRAATVVLASLGPSAYVSRVIEDVLMLYVDVVRLLTIEAKRSASSSSFKPTTPAERNDIAIDIETLRFRFQAAVEFASALAAARFLRTDTAAQVARMAAVIEG